MRNIIDNLIANGNIPPTIFVSPTFYAPDASDDCATSVASLRAFHQEFEADLMPAVEGRFRTYAASTSDEDLKASRAHRAFGGFSLGSVTTWMQFCFGCDCIAGFIPMSGSCWYYGGFGDFQTERNVDFIDQLVREKDLDERGYFIYHAVGTQDSVKEQTLMQADEMLARPDVFTPDHYAFYQKEGGRHDYEALQEFLYNGLPAVLGRMHGMSGSGIQEVETVETASFTRDTRISDAIADPAFGGWGRLIFPVDAGYWSGGTLGSFQMTWYNGIDADMTVEVCNYLRNRAASGETVFVDIYSDEEKAADPAKADTGLLFFRGDEGARTAIVSAGGSMAYVGAMHDSFPHRLELSRRGLRLFLRLCAMVITCHVGLPFSSADSARQPAPDSYEYRLSVRHKLPHVERERLRPKTCSLPMDFVQLVTGW